MAAAGVLQMQAKNGNMIVSGQAGAEILNYYNDALTKAEED